ncbi:uncharacterized protein BT62DRAFT_299952 [Guyanagaster necrorhizus]|uniref:Uncharacterized protein n=1 Tax=Guyanagaster necrorhizus TaxID=856835 RepID=A0A9P7W4M8_9AGAR|nr:uncharacterized protein BT62DRAFT_299952 [Guyanagaster necrorhizus MCA 3950]KAG7452365.1 hypothetical protein BT62DRAFT_299952 [Guyanagaster necrorhizus MCA 3950]
MPPLRTRDRDLPSMHSVFVQAETIPINATIYYQHVPLPSLVFRYEPYGHAYATRNHPLMTTTRDGNIDWDGRVFFTVALPQPTEEEMALNEALQANPEPAPVPPPRGRVRRLSILVIELALAVTRRLRISRLD